MAEAVANKPEDIKLRQDAAIVRQGVVETLSYYCLPHEHWRQIRMNNPLNGRCVR